MWQSILLTIYIIPSIQALRRITITRNELVQQQENPNWSNAYPPQLFWPPAPQTVYSPTPPPTTTTTTTDIPYVPIYNQNYLQNRDNFNYQQHTVPQDFFENEPETTTVRYLRKVKVHPRGGKNLKETYQHLTPIAEQTTTEVIVTMPAIGEPEPEFSHEQIMSLCSNAYTMASNFGIHNFDSHFAGANCGLIRLYYPDASCKEIETFMMYCDKHRVRA